MFAAIGSWYGDTAVVYGSHKSYFYFGNRYSMNIGNSMISRWQTWHCWMITCLLVHDDFTMLYRLNSFNQCTGTLEYICSFIFWLLYWNIKCFRLCFWYINVHQFPNFFMKFQQQIHYTIFLNIQFEDLQVRFSSYWYILTTD